MSCHLFFFVLQEFFIMNKYLILNSAFFKNLLIVLFLFAIIALLQGAHASVTGGGEMPWESGLSTLTNSITGPVATGICLVGIVGCGAGLAFGGEMNQFVKTSLILVLVVCLIIGATKILKAVTGSDGAILDDSVISNTTTLVVDKS